MTDATKPCEPSEALTTHRKRTKSKKNLKQSGILMALLPLAACGGGGGGGGGPTAPAPAPPPEPDPDFTESPTNVFIAVDDNDRELLLGGATANLTVTGKGGNDVINTGSGDDFIDGAGGSDVITGEEGDDVIIGGAGNDFIYAGTGNDLIRGGEGVDDISAWNGDDAIVVVGTTSAGQYTNSDITNPAGSGIDLSDLITLSDLNGRTVSEVSPGDSIDGGTGTNTLYIYGTVDLTGVTLNNVTVLIVSSDVTLTAEQIAEFTTIDGDGTSTINIEVPPGDTYIIDLSVLNLTDIGNLNIDGDVTVNIDDADDLDGVGSISSGAGDTLTVKVNGNGGDTTVNLSDIADVIDNVDVIEIDEDVTLEINDADDITDLGLEEITGGGNLDTGGNPDVEDALDDNVEVVLITVGSDSLSTYEDFPLVFSFADILNNDSSESGPLQITNVSLAENSTNNARIDVNFALGTVTVTPDQDYNGTISLNYTVTDNESNSAAGQISVNVNAVNDLPTGYGSTIAADDVVTHDGAIYIDDFLLSNDGERLNIDDPDSSNSTIYIRVEDISGGVITKNGNPVTQFTYNDVINRTIEFEYTGGLPSLTLSFSNNGVTFGNPTPVEITSTESGSIYILTQGGNFGNSETIEMTEKYLLEDEDKFFYADDATAIFTNFGVIESYGLGYLTPLYVANVDNITNAGIIDVDSTNDNAAAIYIIESGLVINSGLIKSQAPTSDDDIGIGIYGPDVANSGTIIASGAIAMGITHGSGVNLDNEGIIHVFGNEEARGVGAFFGTSNIINTGTIIVEDDNDDFLSIGLEFNLSIADVTNSGTIRAEVAIDADYSLTLLNTGYIFGDLNLSTYSDEIDNFGEIYGNIHYGDAADWLNNIAGYVIGVVYGEGGNDFLLGGAYHDYFDGGSGDDILTTGSAGDDILDGGISNDTIELQHYNFESVDGGSGDDTLNLAIDATNFNLNTFDTSKITNFEAINMTGDAVTLTLDVEAIIDVTDQDNILRINGQADDVLNSNSEWTRGDDQVIDSVTYLTYSSGEATLLVETGVILNATILNDFPTISINDVATNEAAETATFTVTLSAVPNQTVTVDYLAPDGSNGTLTFDPGETEQTFTTSWVDDDIYEAAEISYATLSNPTNATLLDDTGQLTVNNDEGVSIATIDDVVTNEAEETATFTVSLDQASNTVLTVDYTAPDGSNGTLTFNPGETEKTFDTTWTDDNTEEADEIGWATISNNSLGVAIGDPAGQLTILDDDSATDVHGTSGDDIFAYTNRDDTLANTYYAGDGTDTFRMSTFHVNDDQYSIDLADLTIYDVEIIELGDGETWPGEELIFTADDIIRVTDADNTLRITGGHYDIITTSSTWQHDSTIIENGEIFNIFTSGDATLEISPNIRTMNGILPTNDFTETDTRVYTANSDDDSFFRESTDSSSFLEIIGQGGDDIIVMYNLSDSIWGMGGNDLILASWHNDFVNGGAGSDTMDGGTNDTNFYINDRLSYSGSSAAVNVSLQTGTASGGDAQGDVFENFEELEGSDHDDTLTGDPLDNTIEGGAGADVMDGGAHGDVGDILDYQNSASGVTVNLATSSASGGDAEGDSFANFENIRGSEFDDILTGDDNDNILIGNGGEDTIAAGDGDDTIFSFVSDLSGSDSFDGGLGTDTLEIVGNGDIDLSQFSATNIEQIMIGQTPYFANLENLTLTVQDVLDVTDADNLLIILGNGNDTVSSTGEGWVLGSSQDINGETYNTYTSGGATLLVDNDIVVDIS